MNNIKEKDFVEGGSTITQQLAKNLYFIEEDRDLSVKVAELFMTMDIEKNYSKSDILEIYVNSIYFGDGYYNVKDACNGYFKKDIKDMGVYEATLLAGIPNAPSVYAPTVNPKLAKQRQKQVINKMVYNKKLTQQEADKILEEL